jgi:hypothetical protein
VWVWASPAKVVASSGGSVVVIASSGTEALSTSASLSLNGPHAEAITGRRTGRTLLLGFDMGGCGVCGATVLQAIQPL